ncbi:MAG: hypothetical protein E6I05_03860 [Chloroflexi bacterium]|nr:MAG: hypothetical protein E6I05_03860 [Chloroflexota bacterium]
MASEPVAGRGQRALWLRPIAWLWARKVWISALVGALLIAMTVYVLWAIKDLPDPSQNVLAAGDVMVLDRNGKLIEDWSPAGHYHVTLTLKEMGSYAPKAVLAAEDRNFYNHGAVDPLSTARAAWVDITSGGLHQGGSTITQQLVKIQLLTPQKSITRKVQEIVLAIALEQRYSKDQILGMYLNRVYFGHGAYGVGAAARTYFNKDAKDLSPAQAAFLAGLIQAPAAYDPLVHYELAQERETYVIQGMVATSALSPEQADKATKEARARRPISSTTCSSTWRTCSARRRYSKAASSCARPSTWVCSRSPSKQLPTVCTTWRASTSTTQRCLRPTPRPVRSALGWAPPTTATTPSAASSTSSCRPASPGLRSSLTCTRPRFATTRSRGRPSSMTS